MSSNCLKRWEYWLPCWQWGKARGNLVYIAELLQGSRSESTGNAKYRRLVESLLSSLSYFVPYILDHITLLHQQAYSLKRIKQRSWRTPDRVEAVRTIRKWWIYIWNIAISSLLPLPSRTLKEQCLNNLTGPFPKMI